ncbi:MAG TPA: hypothetical protein VFM10_07020 [Terriglobales bacterium]|nr:hypothetical protein [Terriglobales bacterium]
MTDVNAATPAAEEVIAGAPTETPEVVEPEKTEPEQPQKTAEQLRIEQLEREAKAKQRRIDRLTREKYESRQAQPQPQDYQEPKALTPEDVEREVQNRLERERINQRANDIAAKGEKEFKDFGEKVRIASDALPLFTPQGEPTAAMELIADCDKPHAVLHYLGENPDIAEELADLKGVRLAKRIAQIEAEADKPKSAPQPSKAPKPIEPGKPSAQTARDPSQMTDEEYLRWKAEQRIQARK